MPEAHPVADRAGGADHLATRGEISAGRTCEHTASALPRSLQPARGQGSRSGEEKRGACMIIRARQVVTMDGPPIENGAVAIEGNRIVAVGTVPDLQWVSDGPVLD